MTYSDNAAELDSMLTLLDAAVRFATAKSPTHVAMGLRVVARESFRTLAEVAPAIWTPNCCRDFADRAMFLPTVDHALNGIGGAHARSDTLRAKMAEVQRRTRTGHNHPDSSDVHHSKAHLEGSSVAIRLWRVLQHTFLDGEGANDLRSLKEAVPRLFAEDEDLMGLDWDLRFDNHNDAVMNNGSLYLNTIPEFSEDDMLATWEEDRLSQMDFNDEPFVADEACKSSVKFCNTSNVHLQREGLDSPVWSPCELVNPPALSMHIGRPLHVDLTSWAVSTHGCEELLDF
jgi:hypothetical protein